jgi:hypothetical protein
MVYTPPQPLALDELTPWISATDPKVVISPLPEIFKTAACSRYGFVILQMQRTAVEMQTLRCAFDKIAKLFDDPSDAVRPIVHVYADNEIKLNTSSFNSRIHKDTMAHLSAEFLRMATYYHEITKIRTFAIQFGRTMKLDIHDHDDPLISSCWGDDGLIVPVDRLRPGGTQLPEGDYGFLKAGTLHLSPARIKPALTAIVMPQVQR